MNILFFLIPKSQVAYLVDTYSMRQGLEKMRAHGYSAIPVINEEGVYCGTVTDGDFLWHIVDVDERNLRDLEKLSVRDLLRDEWNEPVRVTASMEELLTRIMQQNFVPVVDDRKVFIGIITRKDVIRYFVEKNGADDSKLPPPPKPSKAPKPPKSEHRGLRFFQKKNSMV